MTENMIGRVFNVLDRYGRCWGKFVVEQEVYYFGNNNLHGILSPTGQFEEVRALFVEHESAMEVEGGVDEVDARPLLDLGAYLVEVSSMNVVDINGVIFISKDLYVTCQISNQS